MFCFVMFFQYDDADEAGFFLLGVHVYRNILKHFYPIRIQESYRVITGILSRFCIKLRETGYPSENALSLTNYN